MLLKPTLTHKGLFLVTVPLVFGLIFIGALAFALDKSQAEVERSMRARAILSQANVVSRLFVDASMAMSSYSLTNIAVYADTFERYKENLGAELLELERLKVNNTLEKESIDQLVTQTKRGLDHLSQMKSVVERSEQNSLVSRQLTKEIRSVATLLEPSIARITSQETALEAQSQLSESHAKDWVKCLLLGGVLANVGISVGLALYFTRNVTRRLNIMRDNSMRLSRRDALNPQLQGDDEIAELDSTFHTMAGGLLEAHRKERALVENAVDVICSIDTRDTFTEVNPAASALWGYTQEDLLAQHIINIVAPEDKERTSKMLEEARKSSAVTKFENRTVAKSGAIVDVRWSLSWSAEQRTLFCVIHDVTERKKVEQLKREFVQMVSHDLRVPLTSLQMTLELLLNGVYGQLTEKGRPKISHAFSELERLINLINQLLEFERMESGKVDIFVEPTDLAEVVTRSVEAVRSLAERRNLTLNSYVSPVEIPADGGKLIQVLVNLLGNAIKFSPKGGTVCASIERYSEVVEIRIADQGSGIPKEFRDKIFDRFEQVSIDDHRVKGGTGLGLAISKSIVAAHGGTIGVDSEEGMGSTFWIRLPAA